jgi:hypothetical protein
VDADQKGEKAARILDDEVYQEAVQDAVRQITDEWTKASSTTERDALWFEQKAIGRVTKALRIIRDRGIKERKDKERVSG